ncbi:MAG TPA: virulence RhuM family protein [Candidatus Deferrimicrobium sp.]|nr:virulence RhuM family protein [Candidatus Deferrimicrobium sp.]
MKTGKRTQEDIGQTESRVVRVSEVFAPTGELLMYETKDGKTRIECRFAEETLWMSQSLIAELFQKDVRTVNEHLQNIFAEAELDPVRTIRRFRTLRTEGSRTVVRLIDHYNLDAVLAVGYRVRSLRGTQFRQWATDQLREYLVKGFVLDDERLKHPAVKGIAAPDHFDEMLERIRDIRASEARVYLRVKEIFALAADYDPVRPDAAAFFKIMQNKLHVAATGKTGAELVFARADHTAENMGLKSWKAGSVHKSDVSVAKNYLTQEEVSGLNRIVVMWLDFAEDQTLQRKEIFLKDWETKLDNFLRFAERQVLTNAGTVSHDQAVEKAEAEYELFAARRREWLEAEGQRETVEALETVAHQLEPAARPKRGKKGA